MQDPVSEIGSLKALFGGKTSSELVEARVKEAASDKERRENLLKNNANGDKNRGR